MRHISCLMDDPIFFGPKCTSEGEKNGIDAHNHANNSSQLRWLFNDRECLLKLMIVSYIIVKCFSKYKNAQICIVRFFYNNDLTLTIVFYF